MSNSEFDIEVVGRKAPRPRRKKRVAVGQAAEGRTRKFVASSLGLAWMIVKPRRPTWTFAILTYVLLAYGTPHVLITHRCIGVGTPGLRCTECRYFGVQGMRNHLGSNWDCPVIAMLPVNWSGLLKHLHA